MPAIYGGEPSSFRAISDALRVTRAIMARRGAAPARRGGVRAPPPAESSREWAPRIGLGMLLAWAVAAALPLLARSTSTLPAINRLGDGPEWLYQALDPHSRNYMLLVAAATLGVLAGTRRLRFAGGALLAMVFAAVFADLVLEVIQLGVDRPRPEEALGVEARASHGRHWSHIPSFPSGHLIVTTALVAAAHRDGAAPARPLLVYLAAVAVTRMHFGAHFPLDVLIGASVGRPVGLYAVALTRARGASCLPRHGLRRPWPLSS